MPDTESLSIRALRSADSALFPEMAETFQRYLQDQDAGLRSVHVAEWEDALAGHVTLLWTADDPVLRAKGIPEISDLRVLPPFRRRGIGSALLDRVEAEAASRSRSVGLHVGLHSGYGAAQRLYVKRGYLPDGSGVVVEGTTVPEGASIRLDDDPVVTLRMMRYLPGPSP